MAHEHPLNVQRIRALDSIEDTYEDEHNELFNKSVHFADRNFKGGFFGTVDASSYVRRRRRDTEYDETYEDYFKKVLFGGKTLILDIDNEETFKQTISPLSSIEKGLIYILIGRVGTGKTTFIKFFFEDYLSDIDYTYIYINGYGLSNDFTQIRSQLSHFIISEFEKCDYVRNNYGKAASFYRRMLEYQPGIETITDEKLLEERRRDSFVTDLFSFVLDQKDVSPMFLIVDNLDEKPIAVIKEVLSFAENLYTTVSENALMFRIIIPLRDYTARYFATHRYASLRLYPAYISDIVEKRLKSMANQIAQDMEHDFTFRVEYTIRDGKQLQSRTFIREKKNIVNFLMDFAEYVFDDNKGEINDCLQRLTNYNIKQALELFYCFLHSTNLDLTPFYCAKIIPKEALEHSSSPMDFRHFLECVMTVHFPFYDVKRSPIINLFNLYGSKVPNDYKNTLTMPSVASHK